jgi:hypothetical protein
MMKLKVDPSRDQIDMHTDIYVRAWSESDDKWVNADIVHLDKESLLHWLKSRGGDNPWAEDVVGILLGHGHFDR